MKDYPITKSSTQNVDSMCNFYDSHAHGMHIEIRSSYGEFELYYRENLTEGNGKSVRLYGSFKL